jgi:hypothetical protein
MMGILLSESIFPEMPDHKPLASAGDEAATKVCEVAKVVGPPIVATALIVSLVKDTQVHIEPGSAMPVTQVTFAPTPQADVFPVGRTMDSNDVVIMGHQQRERDYWALIQSTMNMQNPAVWMAALSSTSESK